MPRTFDISDTSAAADSVQLNLLRKMPPKQRMAKFYGLSASLRRMAFEAIYRMHPDYTEDQARLAFIEATYGKSLADDVRRSIGSRDCRMRAVANFALHRRQHCPVRDAMERQSCFNLIHIPTAFKIDVFISGGRPFDSIRMTRPNRLASPIY